MLKHSVPGVPSDRDSALALPQMQRPDCPMRPGRPGGTMRLAVKYLGAAGHAVVLAGVHTAR